MNAVLRSVLLALVAALSLTSAALAGGFAVTTLDPLPRAIQAGQTYRIGYMVRQHGVTPVRDAQPVIRISQPAGAALSFAGVQEGAPGHYVSDVRFPSEGAWTWSVDQNPFAPQPLGTLEVQPAPSTAPIAEPIPALKPQPPVELAMAALVALLLAAVALVVLQAKRLARPAAGTETASMLTQAHRKTSIPSRT